MASVKAEGGKFKGTQAVRAQFIHSAPDSRLEHEHSNPDIDKSRTHLNTSINGLLFKDVYQMYRDRIHELDSSTNTNRRKDRVTMVGLELTLPNGIPADQEDMWFKRAVEVMQDVLGEHTFMECYIHRDELHTYSDATTGEKKLSRTHGHTYWVPEHDGKLNAKWFTGLPNLVALNNAVENMSVKEFGVHYMTGEKSMSKGSTELLKKKSAQRALKEANEKKRQAENCLKAAHSVYKDVKARERASEKEVMELYQRAEKALTEAPKALEWHPDNGNVEDFLKRHKSKYRQKDGSLEEKSWWDVFQEDTQRRANEKRKEQLEKVQRQQQEDAARRAASKNLDAELERVMNAWNVDYAKSQQDMASFEFHA